MEGLTHWIRIIISAIALSVWLGCSSAMLEEDDVAPTEADSAASEEMADDLDFSESETTQDSSQTKEEEQEFSEFESLDEEEKVAEETPPPVEEKSQIPEDLPAVASPEPAPEPIPEPAPVEISQKKVTIQSIQFKPNDNGGSIVVQADGSFAYTQRSNTNTRQLVVEIPNSILPERLRRPLITKDIPGTIGSVDAYQSSDGNSTRIVVQVRSGYSDPVIQMEGNALLIVSNPQTPPAVSSKVSETSIIASTRGDILSYASLEDFLTQNGKFYGEKVNLQFDEAVEVKEILKFLADEAGINMIIADEVKGTMSLKLRGIPWDQAFVLILKSKKLSYTRTGNVLRVALASDIQKEQDDALKLANSSKDLEPLKVKLMPVSYAKIEDMSGQVKGLLSKRGTVIADSRTTTLVVSDIEENIVKVEQFIRNIDIPPQQVMIEGKIIEALDEFTQNLGINWGFSGSSVSLGSSGSSSTNLTLGFNSRQSSNQSGTSGLNLNIGALDILGSIDAAISLSEQEGTTKVLSAPRIMTLNNEQAEIRQTVKLPSQQTSSSTSGGSVTGLVYTDLNLSLNVTPQITNDGHIIMNITATRDVPTTDNPPQIQSRNAKTKVMVRNGQTAVIGGIYQNDTIDGERRFPGLSKLPFFGWMFKSSNTSNKKNELMIFLTPKIVARR